MIVIEQCRIDSTEQYLFIDASIENLEQYKNYIITKVYIQTKDAYSGNGPDLSVEGNYEITEGIEENATRITLRLNPLLVSGSLATFKDLMFFVYVEAKDTENEETYLKCAVVYDIMPLYIKALGYIRELKNKCFVPSKFIDFILQQKAFELSLRTGNYTTAIQLWDTIFSEVQRLTICNCHGSY